MRVIGIDPGRSGAAVAVETEPPYHVVDVLAFKDFDPDHLLPKLTAFLYAHDPELVTVEKVQPARGVSVVTSFMLGYMLGTIELACQGRGYYPLMVSPSVWKQATRTPASKKGALKRANVVFPTANFTDHNIAEAALLAVYGYLKERERQHDPHIPTG